MLVCDAIYPIFHVGLRKVTFGSDPPAVDVLFFQLFLSSRGGCGYGQHDDGGGWQPPGLAPGIAAA
jgi:hypothetical protein